MATIAARAEGTWAELTNDGTVTIPGGAVAGDMMYLLASWKDFAVTASVAGWTEVTQFTDGAVATGNGTGSMKVGCWYKQHTGSEANPTLDFSGAVIGAAVIIVFSKGVNDVWATPAFATAAMTNWTTSSQTVTASSDPGIAAGDLVIGLIGIRDDSATMTRPTTGINATGITWAANYVEYPATHFSTTTGDDMSADAGYRIAGDFISTAAPTMTGTISAAETGAGLWIRQRLQLVGGADTFTRSATDTWGTAESGGPWAVLGGSGGVVANFDVTGSAGTISVSTSVQNRAVLPQVFGTDMDVLVKFSTDKVPTVANTQIHLSARDNCGNISTRTQYQAGFIITTAGALQCSLSRRVTGTETNLVAAATISGITVSAGSQHWLRFQVEGTSPTTLRAKAWNDGSAEPQAWFQTTTDSTAGLQQAGSCGLQTFTSATVGNVPLLYTLDNFETNPFLPIVYINPMPPLIAQ